MPKLEIKLSEKEINDLIDGKKVSLGKLGEYSDVYLIKEENEKFSVKKEANDYKLFLNGKEIRIINSEGKSYTVYDGKNTKKGDIVSNKYGCFRYDGFGWHKMEAQNPSKDLVALYRNKEHFVYLCPGYKCYLTNNPLDDSVGEDGDLNMFGHGNSFKVKGKWEYYNLKNGINEKSMNQVKKWKDSIMFGNDFND